MDCDKAHEEFSAFLDGELTPEARAAVEAHLAECSSCLRELEAFRRVDALYAGLPRVSAPEDLEKHVRALVASNRVVIRPRRRPRWTPIAAAAAALVLVAGVAWQVMQRDPRMGDSFQVAETAPDASPQAATAEPMLQRHADEAAASRAKSAAPMASKPAAVAELGVDAVQSRPERMESDLADSVDLQFNRPGGAEELAKREVGGAGVSSSAGFGGGGGFRAPAANAPDVSTREFESQSGARASLGYLGGGDDADANAAPMETPVAPAPAPPSVIDAEQNEDSVLQESINDFYQAPPADAPATAEAKRLQTLGRGPETPQVERFYDIDGENIPTQSRRIESEIAMVENEPAVGAQPPAAAPPEAPAPAPIPRMNQRAPGEMAVVTDTRTLRFQDGVWTQSEYRGESLVTVTRDSETWKKLVARDESLIDFLSLEAPIIFRESGIWYRLDPKAD